MEEAAGVYRAVVADLERMQSFGRETKSMIA